MLAFKANPTPLFFTCLASWFTEIDISNIVSTPLLHLAFESLFSDELFDAVVDFIVAMFRETRDVYDNTSSIKYLYDELYAVGQKLGAFDNSDPDVFRGITRMYVEAGEAWVVLIAHEPEKYEFIVRAVAQCTEYNEDLEVTKITFNFWYELTQLITVDKHRRAKELFTAVYAGLVDTMISHLHYPEGSDRTDIFKGDRVAEDKFRDFRHEMGDVLKDCCRVVGGSACLGKAYFLVGQKLEDQQRGVPVRWQEVEAPLFSMRMMAREVDTEESEVVPEVMKLLVSLPEHDKIRYAATLVLGRYTEWTAKHPEYLEFQLNYISSGFENQSKDVISAAAQALKHFCQDCKKVYSINKFTDISIWLITLLSCFHSTKTCRPPLTSSRYSKSLKVWRMLLRRNPSSVSTKSWVHSVVPLARKSSHYNKADSRTMRRITEK